MHRVVLLRHGESLWNQSNRFTGWTDVGLTDYGERQAREAGRILKKKPGKPRSKPGEMDDKNDL